MVRGRSLDSDLPGPGPGQRGSWMECAMDLAQVAFREMGVNLRGRDVGMAEHLLHRAQIGAALQKMGREAVSERVWADPIESRVTGGPSLESLEESLARHRPLEPAQEHGRAGLGRRRRHAPRASVFL